MKEKLAGIFEQLQSLDIRPTLGNMEILVSVLYELREIYNEMGKDEGHDGNGPEAGPEGRDED